MPFNRVNNTKAISFWLLVLASSPKNQDEDNSSDNKSRGLSPGFWFPGLMVVPLPQAGFILGYLDIGYWAAFFYVWGSVMYIIDSCFIWPTAYPNYTDDAADPGVYLNTMSAGLFVINALLCFLDWHLQRKQLSAMNMILDDSISGGYQLEAINNRISWYYFFNNFFFLGAAVIYLIQSIWAEDLEWDLEHCSTSFCGNFWINFWGSFLYLMSSVFAVFEFYEDKRMREKQGLPPMTLLPISWESFDWFGWGDILYVVTSMVSLAQAFFLFSSVITDDFYNAYYLNTNILFLFDSLAYFIGYVIFVYDLRRALFSGRVPIKQTAGINALLEDCRDEMEEEEREKERRESIECGRELGETMVVGTGGTRGSALVHIQDGYVTIDEIREKIQAAKVIRARRSFAIGFEGSENGETHRVHNPINARRSDTVMERGFLEDDVSEDECLLGQLRAPLLNNAELSYSSRENDAM